MEENDKALELALKMADMFNGYTVGDVLRCLEMTTISVINSVKDEPLKQIMACSQMINSISEALTKITVENIIKHK